MSTDTGAVQASYDQVATEYASRVGGALAHKAMDRELLARFAAATRELGRICDVGCGPGHVAAFLRACGARTVGVDVSAGMLREARRLHPDLAVVQGDILDLGFRDAAFAGIVAFYSLVHFRGASMAAALRELRRILYPGGVLLLAAHVGGDVLHLDEMWGTPVSLDLVLVERTELEAQLADAGFEVEEAYEREPYADVEMPTRRIYVLARNGWRIPAPGAAEATDRG